MEQKYYQLPYYEEEGKTHFGVGTAQIFYSQCGEDLEVYVCLIHPFLEFYRQNKGVFVEVGAGDGVRYSNTKFLEDELGFGGILIEPSPYAHKWLKKTRPQNRLYDCAVLNRHDSVEFMIQNETEGWAVSGVTDLMRDSIRKNHHNNSRKITVSARPLREITTENSLARIDFLSIDVEGAELEVLKSMDWSIPTYVAAVELGDSDPNDLEAHKMLIDHGFVFLKKMGLSKIYFDPHYFKKINAGSK